ncbi:hypothetical protein VSS74_04330 [Conexibacter stalactiti]|uniref:Ig-like domain-containing protein n=1 Tax=Conexibacter stalactiti TaxID=1940611 RepID=A0ABU4HLF1_9ACTN|nr:hypothetical protein [Conexibacter stalactiti]MDW5593549.1 hypothetical protein [Conexibacter stalactiti]MEC5034190.1 hypothetical protein [Conexibacter stalactiti]
MSLGVVVLAAAAVAAPSVASAATWSTQTAANPGTAISSSLTGVACPALRNCQAVGRWDNGSGTLAQAQAWGGTSWALGSIANPTSATVTDLQGISCTATNECTAVGNYEDGGVPKTLVERWTSAWAWQPSPNPSGSQGSFLAGVSCSSSSLCTAVGSYIDSGGVQRTLALRWASGSWTVQTTPASPAGATSAQLSGVSCPSSTACIAVGSFTDSGGQKTYALAWDGTNWTRMTTIDPATSVNAGLTGVSCTSSTACTAVGSWSNGTTYAPLIERMTTTTWATQTPAIPGGATGALLLGVSCTSSTHCSAVGYSYSGSGLASLAELGTSGSWRVEATPSPAGATGAILSGINCRSSTECTAVGQWFDVNSVVTTLALRYI